MIARRSHRANGALLFASVFGPALLLAAVAWWSWDRVDRDATAEISRTVGILQEHSLRLLQIDQLLLQEIDSRITGMDWDEVSAQQAQLHRALAGAAAQAPEIDSIFLVDDTGRPRASSRKLLADGAGGTDGPGGVSLSVADRPYFQAARDGIDFIIDGPFVGRFTHELVVDVVRRLSEPDGSFRGIAIVGFLPRRLAQSWQGLTRPHDAISLVRDDGVVLARYPDPPREPGAAPARLRTVIMDRIHEAPSGVFDAPRSPVDNVSRRLGYRQLGGYPLYIIYGIDQANILRQWCAIAAIFAALAAAAAIGLLLAARAVIRRARSETEAHAHAAAAAVALRASEESQRALFHRAPMAMCSLDPNLRIIEANQRWLDLFGYRREEVAGRPLSDFFLGGADATHLARRRLAQETGELNDVERVCVRRSGVAFEALISAAIERNPDRSFMRSITTIADISARRRAEEAARRERHFSELLIDSSIDGIIAKDTALRYTVWNHVLEEFTGRDRSQVLGHLTEDVFPDFAGSPIRQAWVDALAGKSTSLHDQHYAFAATGRDGFFDETVSPLREASGAIVGAIAFIHDNTERHRVEEALRQAQKMEAVGQLTGGIAHDFNNLLTVILGNLEALQRRADGDIKRFADAAVRGAERAATLTQRLLAFSRRQPLSPTPLDLNQLVAGMIELLRRTLGERIAVDTVHAAALWRIAADANQLESALINLAVNARDAMPDGGKLTIETANAVLDEDYALRHEDVIPGQYAMIAVSDNGSGMAHDVVARAFEPFYTTKEIGRGSGLGLSQVYGFVRQSGGHVRIDSEPGRGTEVRLYLPRLAGETTPADVDRTERAPSAVGNGTVLVVEDEAFVREHTAGLLRELGYRVVEAADGPSALRLIEDEGRIGLLFTDVGLPGGLNGHQLGTEVERRWPGTKVLYTTGYARDAIGRHGRLDPGLHLIVKPFTFAGLAAKVKEVLQNL